MSARAWGRFAFFNFLKPSIRSVFGRVIFILESEGIFLRLASNSCIISGWELISWKLPPKKVLLIKKKEEEYSNDSLDEVSIIEEDDIGDIKYDSYDKDPAEKFTLQISTVTTHSNCNDTKEEKTD